MREIIKKNLSGKKVLLFLILANIVYVIMLTITIPKVMSFSCGMKILDMMPTGYNPEYVNTLLNTLGEKGRNAYLFFQLPIDMIYPFLFGVSYCMVIAYFLNKFGKLESNLFYLCFLPLFAGLFDYAENIGIITMLNTYPKNSILVTHITNVFTLLKSFLSIITFIIVITCLIAFVMSKLLKKAK